MTLNYDKHHIHVLQLPKLIKNHTRKGFWHPTVQANAVSCILVENRHLLFEQNTN